MPDGGRTPKRSCPPAVRELIERFALHRATYRQATYNETQVRREFIDPMFKALGWDIDNEQGHAEAYKDVVHEDAIKVGGSTKAPDYCFRVGGVRKFFVEAKKPAEDIKQKQEHAYQLRRYAWTAKLPVSILTDFEEFAVYDCTKRPKPTDKAATSRVLYATFDEYARRWGEIASVFSKDAILTGSFDKFAESTKRKRGTAEVDTEFLKEIEQWRDLLAHNIALRNPRLTVRELNYAVSKTIDRIIFLRMCEDRGVETYAQLRILPNGPRIYPRLVELFRRADERYNSGLFHFEHEKDRAEEPDTLTPGLTIDDKVLKDIIKRLYYPDCPYEFSVMPAEILGQVYEQFLGKVITLTAGHRARIEFKPEVKKAGGVYYTPKYIVDYIVEHTVGRLLEGKTPANIGPMLDQRKSAAKRKHSTDQYPSDQYRSVQYRTDQYRDRKGAAGTLRVLDPACGSGSFLLGAYQYLLDWHLKWYIENDPEAWARKKNPPIYEAARRAGPLPDGRGTDRGRSAGSAAPNSSGGASPGSSGVGLPGGQSGESRRANAAHWRLTIAERKRILLNNMYGVDIDPQAVEVTKLSLLLNVLEGESQQSLDNQLRLFHERALPDLAANIKCGNSLIGPDFYDGQQLDLLDEEERYRINVFDWHAEFPQVFQSPERQRAGSTPGFDAVIGNPPYVRIQTMQETSPETIDYYKLRFGAAKKGNYDIYVLFVEQGLQLLNATGRMGLILPHKFFNAQYGRPLRQHLSEGKHVAHVVHFGDQQVFAGATTYTCLLFLDRSPRTEVNYVKVVDLESWRTAREAEKGDIPACRFTSDEWSIAIGRNAQLFERLALLPEKLAGVVDRMYQGPITSADTVFLFKEWRAPHGETIEVFSKKLGEWVSIESAILKAVIRSGKIGRFCATPTAYVLFPYQVTDVQARLLGAEELMAHYPLAWSYFQRNRKTLEQREKGKFKDTKWYRFGRTQNLGMWEQPKLMIPYMITQLAAYLDKNENFYFINVTTGGYGITTRDPRVSLAYLCALLNSRLLDFYLKQVSTTFHGGYFAANKQYIEQLPIRTIDFSAPADRTRHDRTVGFVDRIQWLHKRLAAAKTPTDKTAIQRQIDATDQQIDSLVYELYRLTDEEIAVVEESTAG